MEANLANALHATVNKSTASDWSLASYVFFWQDWLSLREKCGMATGLLALLLTIVYWLQSTTRHPWLRNLGIVVTVLWSLMMGSVALEASTYQVKQHGVVVTGPVTARKGNSANYEPAYTKPLSVGTEFTVLERRDDWLHVALGGLGSGWIPARDAEVF